MLEPTTAGPTRLDAAPRHLRRRIFRREIRDALLVPHLGPLPLRRTDTSVDKLPAAAAGHGERAYRRKRLVALLAVIGISVSIPLLLITLVFAG